MSVALDYSLEVNKSKQFQFLQGLTLFHPSLKLSQPTQADIDLVVGSLLAQLKREYPKAGPAYWSNRCWALIYWQPVYIAVYAVHKHHSWIAFDNFLLGFNHSKVSGFYFSESSWLIKTDLIQPAHAQEVHALINQQAIVLKTLLQNYLQRLSSKIKINRVNAWRLISDCILMVMLELDDMSNSDKLTFSNYWLTSLGLYDKNNKPYSQLNQLANNQLILKRQSCCMHYLIDAENPCSTCNKFSRKLEPINKDK